jgi:hypothetical protein
MNILSLDNEDYNPPKCPHCQHELYLANIPGVYYFAKVGICINPNCRTYQWEDLLKFENAYLRRET